LIAGCVFARRESRIDPANLLSNPAGLPDSIHIKELKKIVHTALPHEEQKIPFSLSHSRR
jgi:hypothetical protein